MELDLKTPVSRPPSLESGINIAHQCLPIIIIGVVIYHLDHLVGHWWALFMPDSREGGLDTGVGRSSSI
jgi:hypothetical protein